MGASHAIGHVLGGSAGVPHGYTSCVMLPAVLAFNASVNADRQAEISAALGAEGQPAAEVLDRFISDLGLPRRLRDVGVKPDDLQRIATNCMLDDWTFTNPRKINGAQEIVPILEFGLLTQEPPLGGVLDEELSALPERRRQPVGPSLDRCHALLGVPLSASSLPSSPGMTWFASSTHAGSLGPDPSAFSMVHSVAGKWRVVPGPTLAAASTRGSL